ncbi:FAD-dependent oxidoreductase [Maribellus maritimus]|uniref:FAD-dependent oxidoreductase n=1 Tax=Maribellus maritimus TaxID=2870838 RepID=UPI001EEB53FB|nr:FAD-dependent oxidoreductase [Maribellus maritimus]MCG6190489.1 FAD-dependent oxidoreductase [Maribellus maritimus]
MKLFMSVFLICFFIHAIGHEKVILLETESFQNRGGWAIDQQFMDEMGSPFLLAHGLGNPVADAETTFEIQQPNKYYVWVRTRDWVGPWKKTGVSEAKKATGFPGKFKVLIDGQKLEPTFGTGNAEWHWQSGGSIQLRKGKHRIVLHDLTGFDGRCDAICITAHKNFMPPNSLKDLEKLRIKAKAISEIKDQGEFDLVVVGGGIAGICSAVSGARLGLKVALVQNRPILGGNNSSEVRVWLGGKVNFKPYPKIGNVVNELEQKNRGHYGLENKGKFYEDDMKEALLKNEKNISLFLNFHANKTKIQKDEIKAVFAQNIETGERIKITGKYFADCTGNGSIGALSGAEFQMTEKGHMGRCNLFNFIETETEQPFPKCPWALDLSDKPFPGRGDNKGVYGNLGLKAMGSWFWESGFDRDPILEGEYIRDWNFRAAFGAWDCLKNVDNQYPKHRFNWMAHISGLRESRRLLGDVVLTFEDIQNDKKYEDGCVPTSWSLDLHLPFEPYYKGFEGDGFISYDHHEKYKVPYWVPYRCLYSKNIKNLFMAGRDISVTHEALGVVRVMRTGGMMGEVVGMAAKICVEEECNPREVYEKYLDILKSFLWEGIPSK